MTIKLATTIFVFTIFSAVSIASAQIEMPTPLEPAQLEKVIDEAEQELQQSPDYSYEHYDNDPLSTPESLPVEEPAYDYSSTENYDADRGAPILKPGIKVTAETCPKIIPTNTLVFCLGTGLFDEICRTYINQGYEWVTIQYDSDFTKIETQIIEAIKTKSAAKGADFYFTTFIFSGHGLQVYDTELKKPVNYLAFGAELDLPALEAPATYYHADQVDGADIVPTHYLMAAADFSATTPMVIDACNQNAITLGTETEAPFLITGNEQPASMNYCSSTLTAIVKDCQKYDTDNDGYLNLLEILEAQQNYPSEPGKDEWALNPECPLENTLATSGMIPCPE